MKNPKDFAPTPHNYSKVIDRSATGSGDLKHNATRPWTGPTPHTHSKPTKHSGADGMGNPTGAKKSEVMTSPSHFKKNDKSMPGVPKAAKKWHKSGRYDMTSPSWPMAEKKWIMAHDGGSPQIPVPFSGPKGLLGGFDARNRAAKRLDKPGSHVPAMKESKETPSSYKTPLSSKMGEPVPVRKWTRKYL